jgi:hypothetical protein
MTGSIKISARILLGLSCVPMVATSATVRFQQGVDGYSRTADTDVRLDQSTISFGTAASVRADNDNPIAHGLLRFDNIVGVGPGQIPPNATISSATLTLRTINQGDPVWFHRMLVPWEETNTWNTLSTSGGGLQADDIEMVANPDFTFSPVSPVPRVDSFDVAASIQGWVTGTFPNYGWGITNQGTDGWLFDSSENGILANRPMLEVIFFAPPQSIEIVSHPAHAIVTEGDDVTLAVVVRGSDPVYQWFKDGGPIPDATNSTHSIPLARRSDEGVYVVSVHNDISGPVFSSNAVLRVLQGEPPFVMCAYGTNDTLTIFLVFSEIVTNATDPSNYSVFPADGPSEQLIVASAIHPGGATQGSTVVLTLDPNSPIVLGRWYSLGVGGVFDRFGDPIDSGVETPIALYARSAFAISDPHPWRYNDSGLNLSNAWRQTSFDDSSWSSGLPLFGFETAALPEPLRTPLSFTNGLGDRIITYYFRTQFNSFRSGSGVLRFRTVLDDAAAIYLNGTEIFRIRLPTGPIDYMTQGVGVVGDAVYEGPFTVCVSNLLSGDNVLAVEVHQSGPNSADLVFGMELFSMSPMPGECFFVRQPTNQVVEVGRSATFSVENTCAEPWWSYQWYKDGTPILGATNRTYTIDPVLRRDDGLYWVVITADGPYAFQSPAARLTVYSCCPPAVIAVYATNGTIVLQFNEETINGRDLSNLFINAADDSHILALSSGMYSSGTNYGAVLLLKIDPGTPMHPDTPYNIYLEDIEDRFGNVISPQTWPIALFPSSLIRLDASQQWGYDTSGRDLSNTWYRVEYDDSSWPTGLPLFDARRVRIDELNGQPVRTMTTLSNSASTAQLPTHYFRTQFKYSGPASNTVCVRPFIDDGAVYYVNGREIVRVGMPPSGPVQYGTLANRTIGNANFEGPFYVRVTNLVSGTNVLAVEVHQSSLTSADLTFGTEFGLLLTSPRPRLRIALSANGTEIVLTWNGSAVLERSGILRPAEWSEVEGAVSGHTVPLSGSKFFRLRDP